MNILITAAFIGMIVGGFLLLSLSPLEFAQNIAAVFKGKNKTIKDKIKDATNTKKIKGIRKIIIETKEILEVTGKQYLFGTLCVFSIFLFVAGTFISIVLDNMLMIPIMAVGFALLPFWYIMFTANFYKKQLNGELETALSVITTSYPRNI